MFKDFEIQSIHRRYQVKFIDHQSVFENELSHDDVILVDSNILKLYPSICDFVKNKRHYQINANENAKSYEEIGNLINLLIEDGFSKSNRLIAIGGGVTQDITAFISSILLRGVEWLFLPTNLLTQCDSCIGSKTSVNFGQHKNQLGGFYPPSKIFIDFSFCDTLSEREICSGLGEMMHYFLVDGHDDLSQLKVEIRKGKQDKDALALLVERSLNIKSKMVEVDEFDKGPRNVFNYGHSFGHAIESVTNYEIPHGIAVAYGMDLANLISANLGLISMSLRNEIRSILELVWENTPLPEVDIEKYMLALSKDKKNVGKDIKVILTRGLGEMFKTTLEKNSEVKLLINDFFNNKRYGENQ